ncbi:hypothetical protein AB3329_07225 [Streptococcus sp. H31]|uniref:hypothetical protein n=1 Tax=Streptococcus huangxiaojuni TaxID=3237239 RepID=UPI0034A517A7
MIKKLGLTRKKIEILCLLLILVCGLSVFPLSFKRKAVLTYDDNKINYTGYVVNNRMNGQGKLTYENGDVYEGHFTNGVFNGQGTFTSSNGWSYSGSFKNGQADGKGILKAKNGEVYTGTFIQGIYQK